MWWMAAYAAIVAARFALGVHAVRSRDSTNTSIAMETGLVVSDGGADVASIPGAFLLPFYTTDVKFYP
jgi:hypothetical protein